MQSKLFLLILLATLFNLSVSLIDDNIMSKQEFLRIFRYIQSRSPRVNQFYDYSTFHIQNNFALDVFSYSKDQGIFSTIKPQDDIVLSPGHVASFDIQSRSNLQTEPMKNLRMWNIGNGKFVGLVYDNFFKAGSSGLGICVFNSLRTDTRGNILPEEQQRIYDTITTQDPSTWTSECLYLMEGNSVIDLFFNHVRLSAAVSANQDPNTNQASQEIYLAFN